VFTAILIIAAVVIVLGTAAWFFYEHLDFVIGAWEWVKSAVDLLQDAVPGWVAPFLVVALVLSAIGIILKLL
jgi:hypothetical protein